jgi:metal-dependent hydrolase (beta-lactamase superfamily II)
MDPTDVAVLDELTLTVVVDNETDTLSSVDAGVPQSAEVVSLLTRIAPHDVGGHQGVCVFDRLCVACHGFSVLVTARRGDETRTVLSDVGPYGYETGLDGHHTIRGATCEPDPLILDERFLAAHVRGRGVTVLSACSHAGVVNACLGASELTGLPVDVVLGGYHLAGGSMERRIDPTVRDLRDRVGPRIVAPGHCTGWRAKAALAATFAPGRYGPSVVGTRYRLVAE